MPDRLQLEWISASEGNRFAQVIKDFTEKVKALREKEQSVIENIE
jgi:coenzyme F420-reducing hydrogenase delta subunit